MDGQITESTRGTTDTATHHPATIHCRSRASQQLRSIGVLHDGSWMDETTQAACLACVSVWLEPWRRLHSARQHSILAPSSTPVPHNIKHYTLSGGGRSRDGKNIWEMAARSTGDRFFADHSNHPDRTRGFDRSAHISPDIHPWRSSNQFRSVHTIWPSLSKLGVPAGAIISNSSPCMPDSVHCMSAQVCSTGKHVIFGHELVCSPRRESSSVFFPNLCTHLDRDEGRRFIIALPKNGLEETWQAV